MTPKRRLLLNIAGISLVVLISGLIFALREQTAFLVVYGYPGIFALALLSNASVILPVPGMAIVLAMTSVLPPLPVALAAGTGAALGELSGYLGGLSGQALLREHRYYKKIAPWVRQHGFWAVLVMASIPNPLFDLAGIAAGAARMSLWQFLLACWIGQIIKMTSLAFLGATSWRWLLP